MTNREEPRLGELWKHFKGGYYRIICVGHHSENKQKLVVSIRELDPDNPYYHEGEVEPCIRPLEMFMSEVDHEKYPDVRQKYRFERVEK